MRRAVTLSCTLVCLASITHAKTMTVAAGQTTRVAVYTAWKPQVTPCTSTFGVVKVAVRPQHGKLSNHLIDTTAPASRLDGSVRCLGTPIKGLAVFYTPSRGFRGIDSFSLDVNWPAINKQVIDNFTMT